jgi:hypothetical protein
MIEQNVLKIKVEIYFLTVGHLMILPSDEDYVVLEVEDKRQSVVQP